MIYLFTSLLCKHLYFSKACIKMSLLSPPCVFPCQPDTSVGHFVSSVVARILAFTNSCLNPFALYLMSKTFQKQFNQQLCCCCRMFFKRSPQSPAHLNTRLTSVRSTHHSVASVSMINGRRLCQEDCV